MAITRSVEGLIEWVRSLEETIEDVRGASDAVDGILAERAERIEAAREQAEALLDAIDALPFAVADSDEARQAQAVILDQIDDVGRMIGRHRGNPQLHSLLLLQRAGLYASLAQIELQAIERVVTFTDEEVEDLRTLLRRAALDTEERMQRAAVIDAGVQLVKFGLRTAGGILL